MRARQHPDERALAGAVLAEERVDLAGAQLEVHAIERPDSREVLDDPDHAQERSAVHGLQSSCGSASASALV